VAGAKETFLSVLDRRPQSTHAGLHGPYTEAALPVLRRAERPYKEEPRYGRG
jgi:hypothetical protein